MTKNISAELTVLCENSVSGPFGLIGEHGWALHAALDSGNFLLDTGQGLGLAIILGCAHAGLINILTHVSNNLPGRPIHTIIGGTHLGFAEPAQFDDTVDALLKFDIKRLGAGHGTGLANGARLFQQLGDRYFFSAVGSKIHL